MPLLELLKAGLVLLLLAVFLAQLLAPLVEAVRWLSARGDRVRPIGRNAATVIVYIVLFGGGALVAIALGSAAQPWIAAAPVATDRMLAGTSRAENDLARLIRRLPLRQSATQTIARTCSRFLRDLTEDARTALRDLGRARRFAWTLVVVPIVAFVLLNHAPAFRRSALRALPHGHLQWRTEEYLRDVNSALAGFLRAQLAAGVIVGLACLVGFSLLGLPYAGALALAAGVLELFPVIGPLTAGLMAVGQATSAAPVVIFLVALRVAQDYAVYPRLVRRGMHLSSLAVILTVWIGAGLGGGTGVLLALPAAGFLSVSVRHWREYRAIERLVRDAEASRYRD